MACDGERMWDTLSQQEMGAQVQCEGAIWQVIWNTLSGRTGLRSEYRFFFQLKCCQFSHAMSRGWTFTAFPWQVALKAAHAASQIVLGSCISPPHQFLAFLPVAAGAY